MRGTYIVTQLNIPQRVQGSHFSSKMGIAKVQFHHYEQDWLDPVDHLEVFYEIYLKQPVEINHLYS